MNCLWTFSQLISARFIFRPSVGKNVTHSSLLGSLAPQTMAEASSGFLVATHVRVPSTRRAPVSQPWSVLYSRESEDKKDWLIILLNHWSVDLVWLVGWLINWLIDWCSRQFFTSPFLSGGNRRWDLPEPALKRSLVECWAVSVYMPSLNW